MLTVILSFLTIFMTEVLWILTVEILTMTGYWNVEYYTKPGILGVYSIGIGAALVLIFVGVIFMQSPVGHWWVRFTIGARRLTAKEKAILEPVLAHTVKMITQKTGITPKTFKLWAIDSKHMNACASGARDISINTGAITSQSPETLAAIFAHEIGHFYHGHTIKRGANIILLKIVVLLIWLSFIATLVIVLIRRSIPLITIVLIPLILILVLFRSFSHAIARITTFIMEFFGRREEYQADKFAANLGFAPALMNFLETPQDEAHGRLSLKERLLASHPSPGRRILRLERFLKKTRSKNKGKIVIHDLNANAA